MYDGLGVWALFVFRGDLAPCDKNECERDCEKEPEYLLCKGNHAAKCPKRIMETEIISARFKKRQECDRGSLETGSYGGQASQEA